MGNYHSNMNARICVVLTASLEKSSKGSMNEKSVVSQICSPRESKDGTCLGQLTLPSSWWPPFTKQANFATGSEPFLKQPKVLVDVKYSVFETRGTCDHGINDRVTIYAAP